MRIRMTLATVQAVLSCAIFAFISVVLLAPVNWNLRYPGARAGLLSSLALSVLMSVTAARSGSRWFYLLLIWGGAIVAYLAFFYRPPMWT